MFCTECGGDLPEGVRRCPNCGNDVAPPEPAVSYGNFARAGDLDLGGPVSVGPVAAPVAPARPVVPVVPVVPEAPKPVPTAPPVPPKPSADDRRISPGREYKLLLRQGWLVMLGEKRNLIISLLFPVLATAITVWIAGKDMFENYESTKSACFILVCAGIWCGLFNSIATIVKERDNIKRDYVSGALRIGCYTASRAVLQLILCAVQALVLTVSIPLVGLVYGNEPPSTGALGLPAIVEYYIALFLLMYASDAMGLMISSFVKKEELASKLAPYILIAQLLFSGVLFKMEGGAEILSGIMVSRWGMEALGSISDLNGQPYRIYEDVGEKMRPMLESEYSHDPEDCFDATPEHLLLVLGVLIIFVAVPILACNFFLKKVKNDARS